MNLTHKQLVDIGEKFLKKLNYKIVAKEIKSMSDEIPDVIGFQYDISTLLECKVSRQDFLKDKSKKFRTVGGVGNFRFFICPENLILVEELPERWGLIYVDEKSRAKIVHNPYGYGNIWDRKLGFESNILTERQILFTILRKKV